MRDPEPLLHQVLAQWGGRSDLWVFGYASLIWRPEFDARERRPARVHGWHRALRMRSRVNRGTPDQPGLVFALLPGGACRGVVDRIARAQVRPVLERLWAREMPTGVYDPRFCRAHTPQGVVPALAFTLSLRSPACLPRLDDPSLLHIFGHAQGRFGSTLDYLAQTAQALLEHGIADREVMRLMGVARAGGLWPQAATAHPRTRAADVARATPAGDQCAMPKAGSMARAASRSASVSMSKSTPGSSVSTPKDG